MINIFLVTFCYIHFVILFSDIMLSFAMISFFSTWPEEQKKSWAEEQRKISKREITRISILEEKGFQDRTLKAYLQYRHDRCTVDVRWLTEVINYSGRFATG